MPTVDSLYERLTDALADHLTDSSHDASEAELVLRDGGVIRLWVEDESVHAEIDSRQGGPEIWVFGPGGDEVDEFVEAAVDTVTD